MQRGVCTLARRAVIPQPLSATCLWRADEKRGGAKRKLKPHQRYKGKKGDLNALLTASNKWNFNWYKTYADLPEEVKREEMYIPYYNDSIRYNPNDPAELKRYLNRKRAESLREKNESVQENKGVTVKQWHPDQRLFNNDEILDDETDEEEEEMDEEWEEDEFEAEWREREAPLRLAQRKEYRAKRRVHLIDEAKKRMLAFEKMSDADKIKKLIEYRNVARTEYMKIEETRKRIRAMSQEEALEALKKKYGISPQDEERMMRNVERKPTEEEQMEVQKRYKLGKFKVPGELSGFDLFLQERGKERLIGFFDRLMSDEPPKIPPPVDMNLLKSDKEEAAEKDKKEKAGDAQVAAIPAAVPAAGGKPGDKAAPAAKQDKKAAKK